MFVEGGCKDGGEGGGGDDDGTNKLMLAIVDIDIEADNATVQEFVYTVVNQTIERCEK